ncbi:MAG: hypothetical protein H7326_03050 [Bdellovibrionaceae bacterium]|nr:hypothetical protein [Pseudobdellovibrionaceae bacterium]
MAVADSEVILALYVGESFAEVHLSQNNKELHFHRWYLGKDGLKGGIIKFLQEKSVGPIAKAIVASRFPEKILSYRLGGSVAVLTTKGFENWPGSRQPANAKAGSLSSMDLLFSVDERTGASGITEKIPDEKEIAEILEKLKAKQAKRVCLHFLNATQNPANQNAVKAKLIEAGFEVFTPEASRPPLDEAATWRKNILNASLSGTFEEIQEEINLALKDHLPEGQRALFVSGEGQLFDKENQHRLSSIWGASQMWARNIKRKDKFEILYLGLEMFALLNPTKSDLNWISPWGPVRSQRIKNHVLCLQPTTPIELTPWTELAFAKTSVGYEPGPIFMGRGQVPTMLDLWGADTEGIRGLDERRTAQGLQKFKNQLWALNKSTGQPLDTEEAVPLSLRQLALQKMAADIILHAESKSLVCMGALAPLFGAALKRYLPEFTLEILPETETSFMLSQGH